MQVERIGITQNYNNSSRQNFTARFSEKEIVSMTKEAQECYGAAGIPMLDILLGYLAKLGGKVAHFKYTKPEGTFGSKGKALTIDNKIVSKDDEFTPGITLLKRHIVGKPEPSKPDFVRMPEGIFESKWFEQGTRDKKELLQHAL